MITNIGVIDGVFRLTTSVLLLLWSYGEIGPNLSETMGWALWIPGTALALTGFFRHSPLYALLKTDSCAPYPGQEGKRTPSQSPDA